MSTKEIKTYLLENPIDRTQFKPYDHAAYKLGVSPEDIRAAWRLLRREGKVEKFATLDSKQKRVVIKEVLEDIGYKEDRRDDGSIRIQDTVDRQLTDVELFERYGRDDKEWRIVSVWFKDKPNGFLLSVHFAPIKQVIELNNQKAVILEEIKKDIAEKRHGVQSYDAALVKANHANEDKTYLYEIAIPDLHIGKMAWDKEVGENYDIKIAIKRYKDAIETLLSRIDTKVVDRFFLPVGNDMINIDNKSNLTTAGTPQSSDSRFGKMFITAKNLLVETIDRLSTIAPVDVVIVAGNHDNLSMFTLGEVLSAWYHNSDIVSVDNSPKQRKYYRYGSTAFQLTHGNQEKHLELGLIFATEEAKLWAETKFRFCQLGHYHHTKKTQYVSVQEHQGFQVQIIPSLSGTDSWHYEKGYNSMKQAKAFLIHSKEGLIGEFTYTV